VDNVDDALRFYRDVLGLNDITTMTLDDRGLKVGLIKAGLSEIELLEPTDPNNTVSRFLDRRGPGLHHVCFEVEDVAASMKHFEGRGGQFLDPVPRPGAVGLVTFMPPSVADGVLVELAQTSGYEVAAEEPETVVADETLAPPDATIITQTFTRPAGGYTRPGLGAITPGEQVDINRSKPDVPVHSWRPASAGPAPAEAASPTEPAPPADDANASVDAPAEPEADVATDETPTVMVTAPDASAPETKPAETPPAAPTTTSLPDA
jgi:methylmalonyl-CoA epimerase